MCFRSPFSLYKCGKCPECLQDKRLEWSIRLQLHAKYCNLRPFIAHLTYDNEHVPVSPSGKLTLVRKDVQDFIKRLRYYLPNENKKVFKYFISGEYGPNGTHRPHYHCILFGLPQNLEKAEAQLLLQKAWNLGFVRHTSDWVKSYAQLHYVTKYMINYFDEDFAGKTAPFRLASNGFGKDFIDYALKSDMYDIKLQQMFVCNKYKKKINNSRSTLGYSIIELPKEWIFEKPACYRSDMSIWLNPLLQNFRNFIEWSELIEGKEKIYRFPLPRYFAEKLYTKDFRLALAQFENFKSRKRQLDYWLKYSDYDKQDVTPMWLQIKRQKWKKKKKNKKDKNLRIPQTKILND